MVADEDIYFFSSFFFLFTQFMSSKFSIISIPKEHCNKMVSFRSQKKVGPRPAWSS